MHSRSMYCKDNNKNIVGECTSTFPCMVVVLVVQAKEIEGMGRVAYNDGRDKMTKEGNDVKKDD